MLSADLGSSGLTGVEGVLLGSPLENDGRRRRAVSVEGGLANEEGGGEGELGELKARERDMGGIATRAGGFWGVDIVEVDIDDSDVLGC